MSMLSKLGGEIVSELDGGIVGELGRDLVSELGGADDFWKENAGVILGTAGAVAGGVVGGPMGAMAGYSVGSAVGGGFQSYYAGEAAEAEAADIQRATLARERAMLITQRKKAMEGSSSVQFGGRTYGSGDAAPMGGPAGGALASSPSLLARGEYTGLSMVNPSLGA